MTFICTMGNLLVDFLDSSAPTFLLGKMFESHPSGLYAGSIDWS
jgi:hypothetical protein